MHLYHGSSEQFVQDTFRNHIAEKLSEAFATHYRYAPPPSEVVSWRNSLRAMSDVIRQGELQRTGIVVEYQLPLTSRRLDCMVVGRNAHGDPHAVVVELKQWDDADLSDVEGCVETWVGGRRREVLHPSLQVAQYRQYLEDGHLAFSGVDPVGLEACSYLHNARVDSTAILHDTRYSIYLERAPLFCGDESVALVEHLYERTSKGDEGDLLVRVTDDRFRPTKALMDHVAQVISDDPVYTLLDEQLVAFQAVIDRVRKSFHSSQKSVVLVHGGPGTGKSVVAANLVARLSSLQFGVFHATGSRAFTENLKKRVGRRASAVFKYFNNFTRVGEGDLDVLICDEAHRIRGSSNHRFTRRHQRSELPQTEELIRAAKVSVFFIDDMQTVRPGEVGSSELIRDEAKRMGAAVAEYELEAQFRCAGSDAFVSWVDNTLGVRRTANVLWNGANESFDFRVMDSVQELDRHIVEHHRQGRSARLVAGYCWPWSQQLGVNGQLVDDVVIGEWRRPWNARPELTRLPSGTPKSMYWATDPGGIDQVGCIYTAQGFEFDYVGVIWGRDLRYDPAINAWVGDPRASHDGPVKRDPDGFLDNVSRVYRVLLTRGLKGCYVYFLDQDTQRYVESRIESYEAAEEPLRLAADLAESESERASRIREVLLSDPLGRRLADDHELIEDIATIVSRHPSGGGANGEHRERIVRSVVRLVASTGLSTSAATRLAWAVLDAVAPRH